MLEDKVKIFKFIQQLITQNQII